MGIDVTQWRARIGTFCQSARIKLFLPVLKIGQISIAIRVVLFLLLVVHGVESNPGPNDVGERCCSKMRQYRGLCVDKELRKASDGGRLLIDEANIDNTAKITPITVLQQNDSVSHELSTIKPESQSQHNSQFHSQPQPLNLLDQQNRTLSQPQSHSQPLYLPDPQKRPKSESLCQPQSHSQPLYLPDPQKRPESLSQHQSHSQPLYLPDPQKRPESLSQPQSHSQPLYLPDPQKRPESLSQPQSHSQSLYLPDPQKRPESLSQPQSHSQPLYLPDPQKRPESLSQPQSHSQPLYLSDPQKRPKSLSLSQPQLHSILLELKQLKERVDSLESENVSLHRRVEDLETSKERVTKADKFQGSDSIGEDRTGRQEKNPITRNTEKANAADDFANTHQGVRHLGEDGISQDLSSRPSLGEEDEREDQTEPQNCCLSDNREEDHDADEYSSDEVVNDIADKMISSDNMELPLIEDLKDLTDTSMKTSVLKTVGQHTDVTKYILMKNHISGMDIDLIKKGTEQSKTTLLQEMCSNFFNKGSSVEKKWYLKWHGDHFPPKNNDCIVSAVPFNDTFRTVPLPPRSCNALNNNAYQDERVRLASFSTYDGSGFRIVFAKAGFVFDLATNMVVCPWCEVFAYNNVNINNIHLSDCVFLQINIPFHNVPSPPVHVPHRRDCGQVGGINVPPAPVQMPNRQSIGRSGSGSRSEPISVSPVAGRNGVSSQEHAIGGSTEPVSCLDSRRYTLPETIERPNQTDSFKHAIPSTRTFSRTCQSSVHSWNTRTSTCSRDVTGSLNQCHQSASEHNCTVPSGSSKRADYSTDSSHLVPEHSSRGNENAWGRRPCSYDPEQVTEDAENKDKRRVNSRRDNSSNGSKAHSRIDVRNNNLCEVCRGGAVCMVLSPCNHMVTCQNCATTVRKCKICRMHIKAKRKE